MSDDLDLRGIEQRHEPDPQFRAALHRRLVTIMEGTDPSAAVESVEVMTIELEQRARGGRDGGIGGPSEASLLSPVRRS